MEFYAMLKQSGKKTPKRWGSKKLLLHGVSFRYLKWVKLPKEFLDVTGLNDQEIMPAIKKSLVSNYGLVIRCLGEEEASKLSPPPEDPEITEDEPVGAKKEKEIKKSGGE